MMNQLMPMEAIALFGCKHMSVLFYLFFFFLAI